MEIHVDAAENAAAETRMGRYRNLKDNVNYVMKEHLVPEIYEHRRWINAVYFFCFFFRAQVKIARELIYLTFSFLISTCLYLFFGFFKHQWHVLFRFVWVFVFFFLLVLFAEFAWKDAARNGLANSRYESAYSEFVLTSEIIILKYASAIVPGSSGRIIALCIQN